MWVPKLLEQLPVRGGLIFNPQNFVNNLNNKYLMYFCDMLDELHFNVTARDVKYRDDVDGGDDDEKHMALRPNKNNTHKKYCINFST